MQRNIHVSLQAFLVLLTGILLLAPAGDGAESYTNHLNNVDALPPEFLVLNGDFAVRKEGAEGWIELPGTPSDSYGLLFGPACSPETDPGISVRAQFQSAARGRRFPAFGVGVYGQGGFRLQLSPAKKELELFRGETLLSSQPAQWENNAWTAMRLDVVRRDGVWEARGKAWPRDQAEPATWQITHRSEERLFAGQASIWGIPYSGHPIKFDNLSVERVGEAR